MNNSSTNSLLNAALTTTPGSMDSSSGQGSGQGAPAPITRFGREGYGGGGSASAPGTQGPSSGLGPTDILSPSIEGLPFSPMSEDYLNISPATP